MENSLIYLLDFFNKSQQLKKRLHPLKLSQEAVNHIFCQLESRRKGYISIEDMFNNIPGLNQEQLFHIFKFFDMNHTETVSYDNFRYLLGGGSNNYDGFLKFLNAIIENAIELDQWKISVGFSKDILEALYRLVLNKTRTSQSLTVQDFCELLRQVHSETSKFKWDQQIKTEVNSLFGDDHNLLSENQFIEALKFHNCSKSLLKSLTIQPKEQNLKQSGFIASRAKVSQTTYRQPMYLKSFQASSYQEQRQSPFEMDIAEKRKKLELASHERQKLIDQIMAHKKMYSNSLGSSIKPKESKWYSDSNPNLLRSQEQSQERPTYFEKLQALQMSPYRKKRNTENEALIHQYTDQGFHEQQRQYQIPGRQLFTENRGSPQRSRPANQPFYAQPPQVSQVSPFSYERQNFQDIFKENTYFQPNNNSNLRKQPKSNPKYYYQSARPTSSIALNKSHCFSHAQNPQKDYDSFVEKERNLLLSRSQHAFNNRTVSSQKQNILKRAEEEASRKIQQIQRRARMKVLQKKPIISKKSKLKRQALF